MVTPNILGKDFGNASKEKRFSFDRMLLTLVTIGVLLLYAILIFFYYHHWKRLPDYRANDLPATASVSVIIAARNEAQTLPQLILDLQAQEYPAHLWEVIIVNDYSTDGTPFIGERLAGNLRMILPAVSVEQSSKKRAIEAGVMQAKGDLILVTDADCRAGTKWLSTHASFYQEKRAAFIAAPVTFTHNNSLLQIFQSLDFITLQGITAASVSANVHTMCNGANLAYTKKSFDAVNGFEGIDKVATGDDMLLMHKIWKRWPNNVSYLKSSEAIVTTAPMKTWKEFIAQRKRWASKTLVYDDWRILVVLGFILLLNGLFFVLLIAATLYKIYWLHLGCFLISKTMIEWPFVSSVAKFYDEQKLMRYFLLVQPLHIFYTVFVGLLSQVGKYEWKGRRTR